MITYHFPPSAASGSFRMLGFARHLPEFGWQTAVVAPPCMPWEPQDPELMPGVMPCEALYQVPYPRARWLKIVRRLTPYGIWLPKALRASTCAVGAEQPTMVLTSGPPHAVHLLGLFLKRRFQLPWVADFRDPWVSPRKPATPEPWSVRYDAYLERTVFKRADVIVANAPCACEELQASFPQHRQKIVSITNGYDPETFSGQTAPRPVHGSVRIVHTGELYAGRDPRPFLDAVRQCAQEQEATRRPLEVYFLGQSHAFGLGPDSQRPNGGYTVSFEGQVAYAAAIDEMRRADILLLLDSPGRLAGVPAKLYEYLGAGRPILALAEHDSDVGWVLRESGVPHRLASPRDSGAMRQALSELVRDVREGQFAVPRREQLVRFTRRHMAEQLSEVMNDCLRPQRAQEQ
jgi:glycosyltransferase involved in cell wall biosynthesis